MEGEGEFGDATGHTFEPRVITCADAGCHGTGYYTAPGVDTSTIALRFNYKFAQTVTDSLLAVLEAELLQVDSLLSHDSAFGFSYNAALYNYEAVMSEGSRGIHNTKLVQKLLRDAIDNFDPTSVETEEGELPVSYSLSQNYPNPFNPATANVKLVIYDAIGKEVATLVNEYLTAGNYKASFNAGGLASGVYFYRIETTNFVQVKKMILLR